MSIKRPALSFDKDFTIVPNAWARDGRLTLRARGLLLQLVSHAPGWEITIESLMRDNPEGRDAIRAAIKELEDHGYLIRERQVTEDHKFRGMDYILQEPPVPSVGFSDVGSAYVGKSTHKEDYVPEDYVPEDQNTLAPAKADAGKPAPKGKKPKWSDEARAVAKTCYDGTKGAITFQAAANLAQWLMDSYHLDPGQAENAIAAVYNSGRIVTKQSLGQHLTGRSYSSRTKPTATDKAMSTIEMGRMLQAQADAQKGIER